MLAETDNLASELSLAPLALESSYAFFEGKLYFLNNNNAAYLQKNSYLHCSQPKNFSALACERVKRFQAVISASVFLTQYSFSLMAKISVAFCEASLRVLSMPGRLYR